MHHVYARGDDRRPIYRDDGDRRFYLSMLGRVVAEKGWHCLAYCLMDNHLHLLVETPQPNLGGGMQQLQSAYAQAFNKRHGGCGHVFQGRYGAVRVRSDEQLWAVLAYIARNPVAAGFCDDPEHWAWSSYGAILRRRHPDWLNVSRLFSYLEAVGGQPSERYAKAVRRGQVLC